MCIRDSGRIVIIDSVIINFGYCLPVCSCSFLKNLKRKKIIIIDAMIEPINNEPLVQINLGTYSPLIDKNETSKKLTASLGSGNVLKTAKYQKNN